MDAEAIKKVRMYEVLEKYYGMHFTQQGVNWVSRSPFSEDRNPSFHVREVEGHWLFKDFSSGRGGSLIDFVMEMEQLGDASEAIQRIGALLSGSSGVEGKARVAAPRKEGYSVEDIYAALRRNPIEAAIAYIESRGIGKGLIEQLVKEEILYVNQVFGRTYCSFVVRNFAGQVMCIDNHEIGGSEKFVLGKKYVFTLDGALVREAKVITVTEGIVDYLSMKELEGAGLVGIALLGNQLIAGTEVLAGSEVIVGAVDADKGGIGALLDLQEQYGEKTLQVYDLEGYKDPNELLQAKRQGKRANLSRDKKLELYREFIKSDNKSELAREWGVDRSYLYDVVQECEELLKEGFDQKQRGRPPKGKPETIEAAWDRIKELEAKVYEATHEREIQYAKSEFLALRLKWSEREAAELRGESMNPKTNEPEKKPQIKKKKKKR